MTALRGRYMTGLVIVVKKVPIHTTECMCDSSVVGITLDDASIFFTLLAAIHAQAGATGSREPVWQDEAAHFAARPTHLQRLPGSSTLVWQSGLHQDQATCPRSSAWHPAILGFRLGGVGVVDVGGAAAVAVGQILGNGGVGGSGVGAAAI
eukprot:scaffold161509_cov18-Tisochrysis_lutea.AAC.1